MSFIFWFTSILSSIWELLDIKWWNTLKEGKGHLFNESVDEDISTNLVYGSSSLNPFNHHPFWCRDCGFTKWWLLLVLENIHKHQKLNCLYRWVYKNKEVGRNSPDAPYTTQNSEAQNIGTVKLLPLHGLPNYPSLLRKRVMVCLET